MGAHSPSPTLSNSPVAGRAVAATGLTVLGLLGGAGAALADETSSPGDTSGDTAQESGCSVGGTPAGGSGTGSPDGVITNGQCSPEDIEQAKHDAQTDGDPTTRAGFDSDPDEEAGGNPNVVGGAGNGISSQSGTAQKVHIPGENSRTSRAHQPGEQPEPVTADVF